jgi:hypothetical protein
MAYEAVAIPLSLSCNPQRDLRATRWVFCLLADSAPELACTRCCRCDLFAEPTVTPTPKRTGLGGFGPAPLGRPVAGDAVLTELGQPREFWAARTRRCYGAVAPKAAQSQGPGAS